jgi:hypothetical protein
MLSLYQFLCVPLEIGKDDAARVSFADLDAQYSTSRTEFIDLITVNSQ